MKQAGLKQRLIHLARSGKLSHAYILESSEKDHLIRFVQTLVKEITPYSEDIHTVCAEGLSVKDKAIEELLARLCLKPLVGQRVVAVIQDADTMTIRAQNRLLKTLEEPPGGTVLFLLSANAEHLLPTIRSRCVLFRLEEEGAGLCNEAAYKQARDICTMILEGKSYYAIAGRLPEITEQREQAYAFLDAMEKWYRDILLCSTGIAFEWKDTHIRKLSRLLRAEKAYGAINLIEEARRDLSRHINTNYTIKNMVLKLIQEEPT
jgi:DNA polymerase-3 subunit delta'